MIFRVAIIAVSSLAFAPCIAAERTLLLQCVVVAATSEKSEVRLLSVFRDLSFVNELPALFNGRNLTWRECEQGQYQKSILDLANGEFHSGTDSFQVAYAGNCEIPPELASRVQQDTKTHKRKASMLLSE